MASKSLLLLKELLEEDKFDIKEVMEVLGYEILAHSENDVYDPPLSSPRTSMQVGYDEVITIKKEHR